MTKWCSMSYCKYFQRHCSLNERMDLDQYEYFTAEFAASLHVLEYFKLG